MICSRRAEDHALSGKILPLFLKASHDKLSLFFFFCFSYLWACVWYYILMLCDNANVTVPSSVFSMKEVNYFMELFSSSGCFINSLYYYTGLVKALRQIMLTDNKKWSMHQKESKCSHQRPVLLWWGVLHPVLQVMNPHLQIFRN